MVRLRSVLPRAVSPLAATLVASLTVVSGGCDLTGSDPLLEGVAQPNVVLIVTDDQRFDTLFAMPRTQEALVDGAVSFDQAFASNPVCCPFRASLLAGGVYSHDTGVLTALPPNGGAARFDDRDTIATRLQRRGYRTALIGKYLNAYDEVAPRVPPGWDRFVAGTDPERWTDPPFVAGGSGPDAPAAGEPVVAKGYITEFETAEALAFLDRAAPAGPFFLYLAHHAPHRPAEAPPQDRRAWQDYRYQARSWGEEDLSDKPAWVRRREPEFESWVAANEGRRLPPGPPVPLDLPRRQLASLQAIDRGVERLLARLAELGVAGRTVVILTSDNGFLWGEHRLFTKAIPYEESIRVPLVVRVPGAAPGRRPGLVFADLDVAATVLELAGIDPGGDGRSLLPAIADPRAPEREELFLEGFGVPGSVPPWVALRGERWKYVEYGTGERELYDLDSDPFELASLHADPAHAERMADAARRLATRRGLAITSSPELPPAAVGEPYRHALEAWGGVPPYRWRQVGGTLPAGLTLNAGGVIAGTPRAPESTGFAAELTDASDPLPSGRPRRFEQRFLLTVR